MFRIASRMIGTLPIHLVHWCMYVILEHLGSVRTAPQAAPPGRAGEAQELIRKLEAQDDWRRWLKRARKDVPA